MLLPAIRSFATLALLAAVALPVLAESPAPAGAVAAPASPVAPAAFKAVVVVDSATILAGSSKAYYAVGHMPLGSVIEVVDASYGIYNQIAPPGCCAAFVFKSKVQADDKGAVGTVTEDGAECFAAGLELTPEKSFRVQRKLNKGETLEILGVVGDFYRVEEPKGTTVFISADALRKATDADLTEAGPPEATPEFKKNREQAAQEQKMAKKMEKTAGKNLEKTAGKTGENKSSEIKAGLQPQTVAVPSNFAAEKPSDSLADNIDSPATDPALRATEVRLLAAYAAAKDAALPSATAKSLLAEYQALAERTDFNAVDGQLVAGRVKQLTRQLNISQASEKVAAAEAAAIEAGKPPVTPAQIGYDAVGQLKISTVYSGNDLPTLYRLADPTTDHTIAYVIPASLENPGQLLNKLVGVQGEIEVDPTLKLRVIRIKKIEVLSTDGKAAK